MPGRLPLAFALTVALVAGVAFFSHEDEPHAHVLAGIHKIRHVVVIMQENRSFDTYFGTYPGAWKRQPPQAGQCWHGASTRCGPGASGERSA